MTPYFINIDRFKEVSIVNENVDEKLIAPNLIIVEEIFLRDIIGVDLFNEIVTQINTSSVSSLNTALLDNYIEPYLINKTIEYMLPDLIAKIRNKSVMTTSSEFGNVVDKDQLSLLQKKYQNTSDSYKNILVEFLKNSTDYPLYNKGCKNENSYTSQFYFNERNNYFY